MVLENLTVAVSGQAADAVAALGSVRQSLASVDRQAGQAARGLDDVEDELTTAAASSVATSGAFTTLSLSTSGLNLSVGTLSTTLTLSLVPALVALSTTLAPLAATVGTVAAAVAGLAGGFGLVVGSGIVANTQAVREAFTEAKAEIKAVLTLLGDQFTPLILDALGALPGLLRDTIAAIGTDTLGRFARALGEVGRIAAGALPGIVASFVELGARALPVVKDVVGFLAANTTSILNRIVGITTRLADEFAGVGGAFAGALPAITRFGTSVLSVLLPAVEAGIRAFGDLLGRINSFTQSEDFAAILTAFREALSRPGFQRTLQEFGDNLARIFDALVENAPAIIRGTLAIADTIFDIVNAITPVIVTAVNAIGDLLGLFAEFTAASERIDQRQDRGLRRTNGSAAAINRRFASAGVQAVSGQAGQQPLGIEVEVSGDTGVIEDVAVSATDDRLLRVADQERRGVGRRN